MVAQLPQQRAPMRTGHAVATRDNRGRVQVVLHLAPPDPVIHDEWDIHRNDTIDSGEQRAEGNSSAVTLVLFDISGCR